MNLLLHGIGTPRGGSLIEVKDSLIADPGTRHTVVLSNPPFGRKSSLTMVVADGREAHEDRETMLRLPTGIFYAQGVKANVLFFDKKPADERPWTERLWVYDLRTNQHFTLKQNPLRRMHLDEFVECYAPGRPRSERVESERFKPFTYEELMARDKANLDINWLRDPSKTRQPARARDHRPRDRRGPHRSTGRVRGSCSCSRRGLNLIVGATVRRARLAA
jgi:type I restriction enzyme M protein